ncbi:hypothetical protein HanXRQr2_Chr15g0718181 [Helianthus annuus]|uniref:Uncharacterized protein n=1 Tax=Helianthus annuus TaxID=4232 RepID=A0A9K3H6F4_HELAN|nr:hypothetical protein HanXRQr2_Chr15g0718181 [Helianthus annuus]KAJ0833323.1 hypothetical protein HanPSC8_Chr15g0689031 [Helianthus annuus]
MLRVMTKSLHCCFTLVSNIKLESFIDLIFDFSVPGYGNFYLLITLFTSRCM